MICRLPDFRKFTARRPIIQIFGLTATGIAGMASPAFAQCTADSSGINVTCTGTATGGYSNGASGVTLTTASGSTVAGPVVLGSSATVANGGTITGTAGSAALQVGDNSTVTNTGTITSASTTALSSGVVLGNGATVVNGGTLTAATGTNVAQFGTGGTFNILSSEAAATTGTVFYGVDLGSNVATFTNASTTYGFVGSLVSTGNTSVDNAGIFTGSIAQTATLGNVTITNEAAGVYSGSINTGDATTVVNNGTMTLNGLSQIGTALTPGTSFTNNGALTVGNATSATRLIVNGGYTQSAAGTLTVALLPSTTAPVAGTNFGQVYASGTAGTANLSGALAVTPVAGFYPTGSTYNVVLADQGITGGFTSVTGNSLTFISFVPSGVVTLANGQQAYQLTETRNGTYASIIAPTANAEQVAVATGFQSLLTSANAAPTGTAAAVIGKLDFLTIAQAETYFSDLNPAGYLAYTNAMRDQTHQFQRQIGLRMHDDYLTKGDIDPDEYQLGFWLQGSDQLDTQSLTADRTRERSIGFAGGFDAIGARYTLGGAIGYQSGALTYGGGNLYGHNFGTQVALYGAYRFGPVFLDAIGSYQFGHLSATRTAALGATTDTGAASSGDHLLSGVAKVGVALKTGQFSVAPFVGFQLDRGSIGQFTETGTTADVLTVDKLSANREDLLAGVSVSRNQGNFRPYIKGVYRSRLGSEQSTVTAFLNSDTTTSFTVDGLPAAKQEADVDAGVQLLVDDDAGFYVGYQGTYRSDLTAHAIMFGFRGQF